ncbi:MAG: LysR family transcriptional regulator [Myxococcota bacterium]
MNDIDRVLVFRDVVETGGFAQAAQRRGTVHSTISRQIKELETSLGVPLMTRTTRRKELTAAGEVVLRHAQGIGNRYLEMLHELEQMEEVISGELRIQSLVHVGDAIVMPAVDAFTRAHPHVELRLHFDDGPLSFHQSGLDLALTVGLPSAEQLVVRKLCDNRVSVVASPSLIEAHGVPDHPEDLLAWPVVAYKSGTVSVASWPYEQDGEVHTLEVRPKLTVNDGVSLLTAIRRGHGAGYVSRFSVLEELARGDLIELFPETHFPAYAPVYTVRADLALVSRRVEAFEACLRDVVARLDL